MPPQFAMTLSGAGRAAQGRPVLEDINLAFYYGAKIGVVGETAREYVAAYHGGLDDGFVGEARLQDARAISAARAALTRIRMRNLKRSPVKQLLSVMMR